MNYEEKIEKLTRLLDEKQQNVRKYLDSSDAQKHELDKLLYIGKNTAFCEALLLVEQIFGASERSGVGENEAQNKICNCNKYFKNVCNDESGNQICPHCRGLKQIG